MIGQRMESAEKLSWGALFFGLVGTALAVLSVVQNNAHWAIGSMLPLLIGFFLWLTRPRVFAAEFTQDTLEVETPPISIPYGAMEDLKPARSGNASPKRQSFPIQIRHEHGDLQIPPRLNVSSADVYDFLLGQFSLSGAREVNPALADYLQRQLETI